MLDNDRAIYAYLPASYYENTDATYPVVYMHDGQNLWAALPDSAFGTWNVDTAFDPASDERHLLVVDGRRLGRAAARRHADDVHRRRRLRRRRGCRTFPEAIVIGVANTEDRIYEYTPTTDPTHAGRRRGGLYMKMLVTELKPQIDAMLRTRPDAASTALVGSSLGGLISAYGALTYPDVYGLVGEISPSTWWNNDVIVADVTSMTKPAPDRRSSSTSTRAGHAPTTRTTPTCSRPSTSRSATSTARTSGTSCKTARSTARPTGPSASRARCSSSSASVKRASIEVRFNRPAAHGSLHLRRRTSRTDNMTRLCLALAFCALPITGCVANNNLDDGPPPNSCGTAGNVFEIDDNASISYTPGEDAGYYATYLGNGAWHVEWTCDTKLSAEGCEFTGTITADTPTSGPNATCYDCESNDSVTVAPTTNGPAGEAQMASSSTPSRRRRPTASTSRRRPARR